MSLAFLARATLVLFMEPRTDLRSSSYEISSLQKPSKMLKFLSFFYLKSFLMLASVSARLMHKSRQPHFPPSDFAILPSTNRSKNRPFFNYPVNDKILLERSSLGIMTTWAFSQRKSFLSSKFMLKLGFFTLFALMGVFGIQFCSELGGQGVSYHLKNSRRFQGAVMVPLDLLIILYYNFI